MPCGLGCLRAEDGGGGGPSCSSRDKAGRSSEMMTTSSPYQPGPLMLMSLGGGSYLAQFSSEELRYHQYQILSMTQETCLPKALTAEFIPITFTEAENYERKTTRGELDLGMHTSSPGSCSQPPSPPRYLLDEFDFTQEYGGSRANYKRGRCGSVAEVAQQPTNHEGGGGEAMKTSDSALALESLSHLSLDLDMDTQPGSDLTAISRPVPPQPTPDPRGCYPYIHLWHER